ncbi:Protein TRIGALACTOSYLDIACYLGLYCEROL 4, chloroplastic [Linum grandiflorum]
MANLRTAMDSAFWDQAVSSPKTLEGCVKSVPSQAFPVDVCRASRALRIQQLSIFTSLFPFGIVPSISPTPHDPHLGSLALQSSFFKLSLPNWWLGLVGQIRPKKLISSIRQNFFNAELKNAVLDDSLYSIGAYTQFSLTRSTSLVLSTERIGDKKTPRHKFMVYHQHRRHDVTLEAAVPEVFVDNRKDGYWNVPHSVSLDVASVPGKDGGVLYRFGLHGNAGRPTPHHALDTNTVDAAEVPSDLMPGLCAKAACSYQKIKDFWRITPRLDKPDSIVPYDIQLCQPHSALSGIVAVQPG